MVLFCSAKEFYNLYLDFLNKAQSLRMQVKGGSMFPFIKSGDYVELALIKNGDADIRKGEIVLFRKEGHFYIHRVIKRIDDVFITKGDFSFGCDGSISEQDILAKVVSVERSEQRVYLYSKLNRIIAVFMADFSLFLQWPFLFFRKMIDLVMVILSGVQRLKIYRRLIKNILGKNMIICVAQPEDKEQLRDLYITMNMPEIEKGILNTNKEGFWLVAQRKKKIISSLTTAPYKKDTKLWLIFGLVTKPLFRGLGIGEKLTREAIVKAKDFGASEIGLFVNKKAKEALNLYKKIGFKVNQNYPASFNLTNDDLYLKYAL